MIDEADFYKKDYDSEVVVWNYILKARQEVDRLAASLREHIHGGDNCHPTSSSSNDGMMSADQFKQLIGMQAKIDALRSTLVSSGLPKGTMVWWPRSESEIPSGWKLCNGSNSTLNMANRAVRGNSSVASNLNTGVGINQSSSTALSYPQYYGMLAIEKTSLDDIVLTSAKSGLIPYKAELKKDGIDIEG